MVDQDALNKAVDLVKEGTQAVYGAVKDVAPQVWDVMLRQAKINGIECFVGAAAAFLICTAFTVLGFKLWACATKESGYTDSDYHVGAVCTWIFGSGGLFGIGLACVINGLDYYLNPAYWAMMDLISHLHK